MASWSPTWSPRPRWAARWRRSATVTPSASTWPSRELSVELTDAEIAARLAGWVRPPARYPTGAFAKYAAMVASASEGAITRPVATAAVEPHPA